MVGLFIITLFLSLDGLGNESYNQDISFVLWPLFTLIESLTYGVRCLSLAARLCSNTVAGHVLSAILLSSTTLLLYSNFISNHVLLIFVLFILLFIQVMEIAITLVQTYI